MMKTPPQTWTHPSVVAFAEGRDAVEVMVGRARHLALSAIDSGWTGPPYDPFKLAEFNGIGVVPRDDIRDARVIESAGSSKFQIEYNPNRPMQRIRFSIAHEIAHTLFADCGESIRNRAARYEMAGYEWQLEMLCNIAASELLMPVQSFPTLTDEVPSIDKLMELRLEFDVSAEALLLRFARSTRLPCFVFAASRDESSEHSGLYRIDYVVSATSWPRNVRSGMELPLTTIIRQATAVDYTTKGDETWQGCDEPFHIEAVGVPPYPGRSLARVVGIGSPLCNQPAGCDLLQYVVGDSTAPHGMGEKLIVHIVNDKATSWGGQFARAVQAKWPTVASTFTDWAKTNQNLSLGNCHVARATSDITVVSMIAQHGYGPSSKPRIRYAALETCLTEVAALALGKDPPTTVHMPRIGTGQAGGKWELVEEIIRDILVQSGVPVVVYDVPSKKGKVAKRERSLFD